MGLKATLTSCDCRPSPLSPRRQTAPRRRERDGLHLRRRGSPHHSTINQSDRLGPITRMGLLAGHTEDPIRPAVGVGDGVTRSAICSSAGLTSSRRLDNRHPRMSARRSTAPPEPQRGDHDRRSPLTALDGEITRPLQPRKVLRWDTHTERVMGGGRVLGEFNVSVPVFADDVPRPPARSSGGRDQAAVPQSRRRANHTCSARITPSGSPTHRRDGGFVKRRAGRAQGRTPPSRPRRLRLFAYIENGSNINITSMRSSLTAKLTTLKATGTPMNNHAAAHTGLGAT